MPTNAIFNIRSADHFKELALSVFKAQAANNEVYKQFLSLLGHDPKSVKHLKDIPFLPIEFFKSRKVLSSQKPVDMVFTSSGTSSMQPSKHYVSDLNIYKKSYLTAFEHFFGKPENYTILALLPSYLEREGSSLIYMADDLIRLSGKPNSGFYLNEHKALNETLLELDKKAEKVILLGVSFALLDLLENYQFKLKNTLVMETGGMKGRRKEIIRPQLHKQLKKGFGVTDIASEYGMCELLSQAYSLKNGVFNCPPWMKVLIRDPEDARTFLDDGKTGGINIIDLANINSCAFIATQDLGKRSAKGSFEVLGRFDHSDIRGCNLLVG